MKKYLLLLTASLSLTVAQGQTKKIEKKLHSHLADSGQVATHCDVYQYAGKDSSKIKVTKKITYNSNNVFQIISETYMGFKESA